ncbi:UNVERIFIED_ORG: hypothetical protein ABIC54_004444 [Burkholderia sp. 1263]
MNCKPGDLAVIIRSSFPSNIGHIVEVLRRCPACELIDPLVPEWECREIGSLEKEVWVFGEDDTPPKDGEIDIADRDLRPISGVPVDDEVTDDLEITA